MPAPVTLLAVGSRGDVEPLAVVAGELARRGRSATVVAVDDYADLVAAHGARFRGLGPGMAEVTRLGRSWLGALAFRTPLAQPVLLRRWLGGLAATMADALEEVPAGSTVVTGLASVDAALALVEDRGCRMATVLHTAVLPTAQPESHLEGRRFTGSRLDAGFVRWYWRTTSGLSRVVARRFRRGAGLRLPGDSGVAAATLAHPIWLAADAALIPPAPDWPDAVVQVGAIRPPAVPGWSPPRPLADFLSGGEPPVQVGLGSLNDAGGERWLELIGEAARLSGRRVATPAPPGRGAELVGDLLCTHGALPHDQLFGLMAGVVHHTGAGTTAAALRAGLPSAAAPAVFDQAYHARRLAALGVGPEPVALHRLDARALARLIAAVAGAGHRSRAAEVGALCRVIDGTAGVLAELAALG